MIQENFKSSTRRRSGARDTLILWRFAFRRYLVDCMLVTEPRFVRCQFEYECVEVLARVGSDVDLSSHLFLVPEMKTMLLCRCS
jgi:hypothetical protein